MWLIDSSDGRGDDLRSDHLILALRLRHYLARAAYCALIGLRIAVRDRPAVRDGRPDRSIMNR
jgi:hypothetical protein